MNEKKNQKEYLVEQYKERMREYHAIRARMTLSDFDEMKRSRASALEAYRELSNVMDIPVYVEYEGAAIRFENFGVARQAMRAFKRNEMLLAKYSELSPVTRLNVWYTDGSGNISNSSVYDLKFNKK